MGYKVAIIGATGNVGRETLQILSDRGFPVSEIVALASDKSCGKEISFGDEVLRVQSLAQYDFSYTDIAIFAVSAEISQEYIPLATKHGCIAIDHSSHYRMDQDVPLIVPEVNPEDITDYSKKNIIANPNCSVIPLMVALKPLHDKFTIKRIVASTYQSVSGAGKPAMDELFDQTKSKFMNNNLAPNKFPKQIAFNIIPKIDDFTENGDTKEEIKMHEETRKILSSKISTTATCVRVPVFVGHSCAANVEFENDITADEAINLLQDATGLALTGEGDNTSYITPLECVGDEEVYVSRIRNDFSNKNTLNMWVVSDNLRKGAALNAVQIAELLVEKHLD